MIDCYSMVNIKKVRNNINILLKITKFQNYIK